MQDVYVITVAMPGCLPEQDPYAVQGLDMAYDCAQNELEDEDSLGYDRAEWASALAAGGASVHLESGYVLEVAPLDSLDLPEEDRNAYLRESGADERAGDDRPEESDAYVNEPASGACVVSLDGQVVGTCDDAEHGFRVLAAAMNARNYWPNVWHVNERGNTEQVSLDLETGAYSFIGNGYV